MHDCVCLPVNNQQCVRMCVSGFIWAEIKEMWDGGFTEYIHDWWNLMDFAMNSLYLATISLKIVAYVKVKIVCLRQPCFQESPGGGWTTVATFLSTYSTF